MSRGYLQGTPSNIPMVPRDLHPRARHPTTLRCLSKAFFEEETLKKCKEMPSKSRQTSGDKTGRYCRGPDCAMWISGKAPPSPKSARLLGVQPATSRLDYRYESRSKQVNVGSTARKSAGNVRESRYLRLRFDVNLPETSPKHPLTCVVRVRGSYLCSSQALRLQEGLSKSRAPSTPCLATKNGVFSGLSRIFVQAQRLAA